MTTFRENKLDILKETIRKIKLEIEAEYQIDELGIFGSYVSYALPISPEIVAITEL
jgi:hypothetical protein